MGTLFCKSNRNLDPYSAFATVVIVTRWIYHKDKKRGTEMTYKERIIRMRLLKKIKRNPSIAKELGLKINTNIHKTIQKTSNTKVRM